MKTFLLKNTILVALILNLFTEGVAQAYFTDNTIYTVEDKMLIAAADLVDLWYTVEAYDLYSLAETEQISAYNKCYAGLDYAVVVITEDGVYDIDLYIYDSNNKLIVSDSSNRNDVYTATEFQMHRTSTMRIVTKNFSSRSKYKAYQAIILVAYR